MRQAHDGQGIVMFPLATIGRGVHGMVIACMLGSERGRLGCLLQARNQWGKTMSGIGS